MPLFMSHDVQGDVLMYKVGGNHTRLLACRGYTQLTEILNDCLQPTGPRGDGDYLRGCFGFAVLYNKPTLNPIC